MMDFIYELYQNDNFVIYLTVALIILIILFVLVLIFGKKDQKLEETKRLQKIDVDAFKKEEQEEIKLEVEESKISEGQVADEKENIKLEKTTDLKDEEKANDEEEVNVTTFEPKEEKYIEEVEEEKNSDSEVEKEVVKPLFDKEESPIKLEEINFDDLNKEVEEVNIEKDLGEIESIKNEFDNIKIPNLSEMSNEDDDELPPVEINETKIFNSKPQVFSSVFVKKEQPSEEQNGKINLFSIQEDEDLEMDLPTLKSEVKKEETKKINIDDISGETYNIK